MVSFSIGAAGPETIPVTWIAGNLSSSSFTLVIKTYTVNNKIQQALGRTAGLIKDTERCLERLDKIVTNNNRHINKTGGRTSVLPVGFMVMSEPHSITALGSVPDYAA